MAVHTLELGAETQGSERGIPSCSDLKGFGFGYMIFFWEFSCAGSRILYLQVTLHWLANRFRVPF